MNRVSGKVAIITGGALGMGKAHMESLAAEGAIVFVTDIDEAGPPCQAPLRPLLL